jgi:glutamine---fructose-6-phosphate transaminase (isomerizing)
MSTTTEREIREQPDVLERLLDSCGPAVTALARDIQSRQVIYVLIAARGTSDNAGIYAKYLLAAYNGLPVAMTTPSLYTFYRKPPRLKDVLVMGISQSGQSEDVLEVIQEAGRQGAVTACLTNDPSSPIARSSRHVIDLQAGAEKAVAATKTFTASLAVIARLSVALSGDKTMLSALRETPKHVSSVLRSADPLIRDKAERYRYMQRCVVIGRGFTYPTAFETSLKMKELTYVTAEPYSSADFLHGPVAMIDDGFPVYLIAADGALSPHFTEIAGQLAGRGAEIIAASNCPEVLSAARTPIPLPAEVPEWLFPIPGVVPGQLFAMRLALAKGFDPDSPRGLHKVTVTR